MKAFTNISKLSLTVWLLLSGASYSQGNDATEIMKKSHLAYFYAGDDGVSEVVMKIVDKRGRERVREFIMLRLDESDGGNQMFFTYFKRPSDVSRITFMVHKKPDGNDARWIYLPSVDLIKPISADDKNSSFFGSDFTYEDVSGRHWSEDNHTLLYDSTINGKGVYVIESIPIESYKGFARRVSYIDKESMLPLREDYFDKKDKLARRFLAEQIEDIDGIMTISRRSMENVRKGRKTSVEFTKISYNQGITADMFTERYLRNPSRKYFK